MIPSTAGVPPSAAEESNAFDLIRLCLALLVVYTHACLLGGFGEEGFEVLVQHQTGAGTFAVLGFFGISGFLVTRSFAVRQRARPFVKSRLLRILPAFYLSLVLSAFVFAPAIAHFGSGNATWSAAEAIRFVRDNALIRITNWTVSDVTRGLPYPGSLNGALWSLFPEMCCYGMVLLLGVCGWIRAGSRNLLLLTLILVGFQVAGVLAPALTTAVPTLLRLTKWTPFVTAFLVGSSLYSFREHLAIGARSAIVWCVVCVVLLRFGGWIIFGPVVFPLALINLSYAFRWRLPFDLSYGTYVLHFPLLQLLVSLGLARVGFAGFLGTSVLLTLGLAMLSWHLVEAPALRLKRRQSP